jgi:hypothetical protein
MLMVSSNALIIVMTPVIFPLNRMQNSAVNIEVHIVAFRKVDLTSIAPIITTYFFKKWFLNPQKHNVSLLLIVEDSWRVPPPPSVHAIKLVEN